jgi:hypothetical protein
MRIDPLELSRKTAASSMSAPTKMAVQTCRTLGPTLLLLTLCTGIGGQVLPTDGGMGRLFVSVVSPYGDGLEDAAVTLALLDGSSTEVRQWAARTDDDGAAVFEGLNTGTYRLSAAKRGFTARAAEPPHARGEDHRVAIGERPLDVEFEIVLRPAGSIAGRILNPDGTPAPETEVMAAVRTDPAGPPVTVATTTTAHDGLYEIPGLPAGHYLVIAQPRSRRPTSGTPVPAAVHPGVPEMDGGTPVRVFGGVATEGIDVWLLPAPQRFTVSGRVFNPQGRPLQNIVIEHADLEGVRAGVWIVSDPGGYFTIEGVPPGPFIMLARAESPTGPVAALASTELTIGPVEDVRLVVDDPGSIEGHVVFDSAVPPLESRLLVSLVHTLLRVSVLYPREESEVQDDGAFRIPLALGHYRFEISGLPDGWTVQRVLRHGRLVEEGRITVSNGESVRGIELVVGTNTSSD